MKSRKKSKKASRALAPKKEEAASPLERTCLWPSSDVPGISITSPSGHWLGDVHLNPHDFAENHEMRSYCFTGNEWSEDGKWIPLTIFVADHVLAYGQEKVVELLVAEANRRWKWTNGDGTPLGRIPTGLEIDLWEATIILCAVSKTKQPMLVELPCNEVGLPLRL